MNLWLIGAGQMAQDYVQVLKALDVEFEVIGRGTNSASKFFYKIGQKVQPGGVHQVLKGCQAPDRAIVAVGVEQLAETATALIEAGTHQILLEKPGGMNLEELKLLHEAQSKHSELGIELNAEVWLAYNRRFYETTRKAREIILADGGATSLHFEFTELSHKIREIEGKTNIKAVWFLANSTHVIDLAFHLCGWPKDWQSWSSGSMDWHPASARFSGAGSLDWPQWWAPASDWQGC